MAGFLVVAGVTGSLLAWLDEIEVLLSPQMQLAAVPAQGGPPLDPLTLRDAVLAQLPPDAHVHWIPLHIEPGRTLRMSVVGAEAARPEPFDEVFVDPYTGRIQGRRLWGDIGQGTKNLMSFVYRLHYSLALGSAGATLMGIVGLVWTLDCFAGAWLTFPLRPHGARARAGWWARWRQAWMLRLWAGSYRLVFDLHRAGGLWLWAMLFVLAWSSVAFNLSEVYAPVTRQLLGQQAVQPGLAHVARLAAPRDSPLVGPGQALTIGRELAARQAALHGLAVAREDWLGYDPAHGVYTYVVTSDRDIRERYGGNTRLFFDGDTGAFRGMYLPTGEAAGDTVTTWITALHMAALWGLPMKLFVCAMGIAVAALSVTGLVIWARKRRGRLARAAAMPVQP